MKAADIPVQDVDSRNLRSVGYDPDSQILVVLFTGGPQRHYYQGVPPAEHQALLTAPSVGRYFGNKVRDSYPHSRTPPDEIPATQ